MSSPEHKPTAATEIKQPLGTKDELILAERSRQLAQPSPAEMPLGEVVEFVAFRLGDERYGIESEFIREVVAVPEITWLPGVPEFVAGICNVRGKITSVVDLKRLLGLPLKGLSDFHTVIVAQSGAMEVGLLVDHVFGTELAALEALQPSLVSRGGTDKGLIRAITPGCIALIDGKALLGDRRLVVEHELNP